MSSLLRSIRRKAARNNMEKTGHSRVAKKMRNPVTGATYSYFQENWRKWA